jgi:type II secretory pathway pseudopilin PulG
LIGVLAAAALALPLLAATLTRGERDRALSELHASRKQFLDAIDGLSAEQWNYKADDKTWSIAECAEHIALTEDVLPMMLPKLIASPVAATKPEGAIADEAVLQRVRSREQKAKAPEIIQPKHKWANREDVTAAFKQSRDRTLDYVRTTDHELRGHYSQHQVGNLDAYQWVLLISAHTERHTAQILEVKADPKFPKK